MIFELNEIMKVVTADDAVGYFIHAGYFWKGNTDNNK
jgi:hypothetical protein